MFRGSSSGQDKNDDPESGWRLHTRTRHFHDAYLLFDDYGRVFAFHGSGQVTELNSDLSGVKESALTVPFSSGIPRKRPDYSKVSFRSI